METSKNILEANLEIAQKRYDNSVERFKTANSPKLKADAKKVMGVCLDQLCSCSDALNDFNDNIAA